MVEIFFVLDIILFQENTYIKKIPLLFSTKWYVASEKRLKLKILSNFKELDFSG